MKNIRQITTGDKIIARPLWLVEVRVSAFPENLFHFWAACVNRGLNNLGS